MRTLDFKTGGTGMRVFKRGGDIKDSRGGRRRIVGGKSEVGSANASGTQALKKKGGRGRGAVLVSATVTNLPLVLCNFPCCT